MAAMTFDPYAFVKELELRLKHDLTLRLGSMMVVAIGSPLW